MTSRPRPTFRDAYLVDATGDGFPAGVVRRERNVWRIFRFGIEQANQPREAFATREEAGLRLLELLADS